MKTMKKLVLAIDFDGTIVNTNDWDDWMHPVILGIRENAKEVIQKLHEDGHTIIIYTCRNGWNLGQCIDYLNENGIYYDLINSNTPEHIMLMKRDGRKVYADFYIDDHNIGGLPTWNEIYEIITKKANS